MKRETVWSTRPIPVEAMSAHSFLAWYVSKVMLHYPTKSLAFVSVIKDQIIHMRRGLKCKHLSAVIPFQPTYILQSPHKGSKFTQFLVNSNAMLTLPPLSSYFLRSKPIGIPSIWNYHLLLTFHDAANVGKSNVSVVILHSLSFIVLASY